MISSSRTRQTEFNRWYDREHLAERLAIAEARHYVAHAAEPKYFCLTPQRHSTYSTPQHIDGLVGAVGWQEDEPGAHQFGRDELRRIEPAASASASPPLPQGPPPAIPGRDGQN